MNTDDGGPAFPQDTNWGSSKPVPGGMSLLDWFAGQALAGLIVIMKPNDYNYSDSRLTNRSYELAEAMIAEKRKREKGDA